MFLIDLQSVGMNFLNIIYFIVALVVLVMVHEFGHFITAKMFNVYVSEFSIGFGPLIFKKKKGETEYSLRAIPFGGYCALAGENLEDAANYKDIPPERFLCGIKKWKRAIIMIAGVTLNLVLAFFLFLGYFTTSQTILIATGIFKSSFIAFKNLSSNSLITSSETFSCPSQCFK